MEEKIIVGKDGQYPLNGILTIPDFDKDRYPAVVFVHGSGPTDKDERVIKLTPFKDLAEGLAKLGIASLRYDKRTYAYASKLRKAAITVKEETIDDAILASELLRNDSRIDTDNIFIVGHSMGAMLAPRIDEEGGNYKGLIMMAGSPLRLEDIVIRQLRQAMDSYKPILRFIIKLEEKIYTKKFKDLYSLSDEEAKRKKFAGNLNLYYFKEMGLKTAVDYLKEIDKPVMMLQGGKDFQVLKEEDFDVFKEELKDRTNIEYHLYDDLNHCFVTSIFNDITKANKEYGLERHIGDEVINDIADFIKKHSV